MINNNKRYIYLSLTTSINLAAYFLTPKMTGKVELYIIFALSRMLF